MLIVFAVVACAVADSTPAERLAALADRVWVETTRADGLARMRYGLPVDHLPDYSELAAQRRVEFWRSVADQVRSIPEGALSDDELITRSVVAWLAARGVEAAPFYWFTSHITPYSTPINGLYTLFHALPVTTAAERAGYLRLTSEYAGLLRTMRTKLEGQVARQLVPALLDVEAAIPLWRAYHTAAAQHPLAVSPTRLGDASPETRKAFTDSLARLLTERVNPAVAAIAGYLEGPYRAAAPMAVGLSQYANGKDYYRSLVRWHTTTSVSPEELFKNR